MDQPYTSLKTFEDLKIWQEARLLRNDVFQLVSQFPSNEKFRLADQLIRCTRSVTANIAEGYGRYHYQEFIQFCRHSRGSLEETKDHLICAVDCKYIDEATFQLYRVRIDALNRMINAFVNHLKSKKEQG